MIVDSSVLVALALNEDNANSLRQQLSRAASRKVSSVSLAEASIVVLRRRGYTGSVIIQEIALMFEIEVVPFTESQALLALQAYARFGKGQGHPAQLDFGDCMTYALAKETGEPLLYKGDDFTHTDLLLV